MSHISLEEAANTLPTLVQKVMQGEEFLIIQDLQPVAKLVAIQGKDGNFRQPIKAGSAKGLIKIAEDFDEPLEDFKEYMY